VDLGDVVAGRYRLDEEVGAGGMGVVWRATDLELRRVVAIKQADDVRREARIGASLAHPNVITVFDVVTDEAGARLLVMEYLPSRSLARVLREDGPLPAAEAARVGAQVAAALDAMHGNEMVHRDISPGNILVAEDGTAKLTDLGVAMWSGVTLTGGERAAGTPGYVAPEVLTGHIATSAADMYALGVTLSAAVEGAEPAAGRTASWFGIVVSALTHANPKRRPSAVQAREMLLDVAGDGTPSKHRSRMPGRLVAGAGALALVGALVAGVLTWWPFGDDGSPSLVGDPRTVDTCGFIDKAPLERFGKSELERDFGEFNRCDIWVSPDGTDENETRLTVRMATGPDNALGTWDDSLRGGPIRPVYLPEDGDVCERIVLLPDRYRVLVTAYHEDGVPGDRCAMADALLTTVLSVVNSGTLPRTTAPEGSSIATADACALLTSDDVNRVVGGGAQDVPGYANWSCSWTGADADVRLFFVRDHSPSSGHYGVVTDIAGHEAAVESAADDDMCLVRVVHRSYLSTGHEGSEDTSKTEQFRLEVRGAGSEKCQRAKDLATIATGRLPA
jgi:eukaryotic-like serine/threonine-protein kinase